MASVRSVITILCNGTGLGHVRRTVRRPGPAALPTLSCLAHARAWVCWHAFREVLK